MRELEQPLPAGQDAALANLSAPLPIFADESCHVAADVARLAGLYQGVNIKLDKAGGLTEALALCKAAESAKMGVMVGYAVDQPCHSGGVSGGAKGVLGGPRRTCLIAKGSAGRFPLCKRMPVPGPIEVLSSIAHRDTRYPARQLGRRQAWDQRP